MTADTPRLWSREEFEAQLRDKGAAYHIHHPFNRMLNEGRASPEQIRGWVANRYCYQVAIPRKDAAILANCPDRAIRRGWIQRILDHDGAGDDPGGIEAWIRLGLAVGLSREEIEDQRHVLPGVRFAVEAYENFCRRQPWQEAVCASLTELFAPTIHRERLAGWPEHYPWIEAAGLAYFRKRLGEARRDVELALTVTLDHFDSRPLQERALAILQFKLDVLWQMNDAMALKYGVRADQAYEPSQARSSPFKGEDRRGMGRNAAPAETHPHPGPPLEGEGAALGPISLGVRE